jgi:hypothetical protein
LAVTFEPLARLPPLVRQVDKPARVLALVRAECEQEGRDRFVMLTKVVLDLPCCNTLRSPIQVEPGNFDNETASLATTHTADGG